MSNKENRTVDDIREDILRYFYDKHKNASSPKRLRLNITDTKKGLRELGVSGKEAVSNIEYLIDSGWLTKEIERKEFTTKGGARVPSETAYYKASVKTIDRFDKDQSIFRKSDRVGINITNIQGVTNLAIGDDNKIIVNSNFVDLHNQLERLSQEIKNSEMKDKDKLNHIAEIDTIKSQLHKPEPDKTIIKKAWDNIKKLGSAASTISTIYHSVEPLIRGLVS